MYIDFILLGAVLQGSESEADAGGGEGESTRRFVSGVKKIRVVPTGGTGHPGSAVRTR